MIRALIFSFLVLAGGAAHAQEIPAWVIDAEKSSVVFTATQQGAPIEGRFGKFTGDIRFDANRPGESTATIKIQLASVDSQSPDRDGSLIGADWFATESFPESIYTVSKFEKNNEKQDLARGELSLRDLAQVSGLLHLVASANADIHAHVVAVAPLLRVVLNEIPIQAERQLFNARICQGLEDAPEHRRHKGLGHDPRHELHALCRSVHDLRNACHRLVQAVGIVALVVAAIFTLTSLVRFCPIYALVGLSTCPRQ